MKNLTKNLNIDFINQQILIEFTGGYYSEMIRVGTTHRVTVSYSCLSKKLQTIHRNGGKITNVFVPQLQLEMLATNPEEMIPIAETAQLQTTQAIAPSVEISVEVENISEEALEIVATPLPETVPEMAPEIDTETVPDQEFDPIVEIAAEMPVTPVIEPVIEPIVEDVIEADDVIEPIVEATIESSAESVITSPKSKKAKTSTKSGHGFNKPKDDTQPRSTRKPKS